MSERAVEQIVGKMLLNPEFRQLMATDLDQAIAGYDLTEAELQNLKDIDMDDFHQSVTGLDARVSKAGFWN
jgi:hypothetical protein